MSELGVQIRLGLSGQFECKDEHGNVLSVIRISDSIPLEAFKEHLTPMEMGALIEMAQEQNGGLR